MTTPTASGSAPFKADRLLSLDVLRGIVIAGMILVTDPGTYLHVYPQLSHAKCNGPTLTDLIFPCFLVMVGVSVTLSLSTRLLPGATFREIAVRVVRRSIFLILLGLLVNGFPDYKLAGFRIPGILQRIGVCYLLASLLYLCLATSSVKRRTQQRTILCVCIALLALYWLLLMRYPTPGFGPGHLDPLGNIASVLDRAVFKQGHMFQWGIKTPGVGITFDPEGILSTLGALCTTLVGVLAGDELRSTRKPIRQCQQIATAGTVLWLLSLALSQWMPLNKQIYTPTFALWSAGLSLIGFAGSSGSLTFSASAAVGPPSSSSGPTPFSPFACRKSLRPFLNLWRVKAQSNQPLYEVLDAHLFSSWLPPRPASLAWAICIVLLNAAIAYPLYRNRIFLRL